MRRFFARRLGSPPRDLELRAQPLRGGLESPSVLRVSAGFTQERGKRSMFSFVVKRLDGPPSREARVYENLVKPSQLDLAPELFHAEYLGPGRCLLYLEFIRPVRRWPWRRPELAYRVAEQLAAFHTRVPVAQAKEAVSDWNYEQELGAMARDTLATIEELPSGGEWKAVRRHLPSLRRLVFALAEIRRALLEESPLGRSLIHGDVHPGNALVRRRRSDDRPVLLDWGRSRVGSPLEDVSSWLQSLGYWEPEVRRRHDTALKAYLRARDLPDRLTRELRDLYWLAGASNVLSGALMYYVLVAREAATARQRENAIRVVIDNWLRILRRADACWS